MGKKEPEKGCSQQNNSKNKGPGVAENLVGLQEAQGGPEGSRVKHGGGGGKQVGLGHSSLPDHGRQMALSRAVTGRSWILIHEFWPPW